MELAQRTEARAIGTSDVCYGFGHLDYDLGINFKFSMAHASSVCLGMTFVLFSSLKPEFVPTSSNSMAGDRGTTHVDSCDQSKR